MQRREWRLRIEDILDAIARFENYTADMNLEELSADQKTVDAVVRNITIIGEAARHIPPEIEARYPQAPWTDILGSQSPRTSISF